MKVCVVTIATQPKLIYIDNALYDFFLYDLMCHHLTPLYDSNPIRLAIIILLSYSQAAPLQLVPNREQTILLLIYHYYYYRCLGHSFIGDRETGRFIL